MKFLVLLCCVGLSAILQSRQAAALFARAA